MAKRKIEIIPGKRYDKLVVIKEVEPKRSYKRTMRMILCQCDCGNTIIREIGALFTDRRKSCGCIKQTEAWHTHGLSREVLYRVYTGIKVRCYYESSKSYHNYGGIGVAMCDEWLSDFTAFYKWCMDNGWRRGLDIDKDIKYKEKHGTSPGKIYSPEYCSIVTRMENLNSMENTTMVNYKGRDISLNNICRELGVKRGIIYQRIRRFNCSFEDALENKYGKIRSKASIYLNKTAN